MSAVCCKSLTRTGAAGSVESNPPGPLPVVRSSSSGDSAASRCLAHSLVRYAIITLDAGRFSCSLAACERASDTPDDIDFRVAESFPASDELRFRVSTPFSSARCSCPESVTLLGSCGDSSPGVRPSSVRRAFNWSSPSKPFHEDSRLAPTGGDKLSELFLVDFKDFARFDKSPSSKPSSVETPSIVAATDDAPSSSIWGTSSASSEMFLELRSRCTEGFPQRSPVGNR